MASSSSSEVGVPPARDCDPSSSNGVSVRIARLMEVRSEYASAVEFEMEASKVHWSELDVTASDEEDENLESDSEVFESLRMKWGDFFIDWGDTFVVGEKIAEGGQAEIFSADLTPSDGGRHEYVVKVFKDGYSLRDLQKQWPLSMLQNRSYGVYCTANSCLIYGVTLLENGRFAFRMEKYWGDLLKLIDFRMQLNHNQCPPFTKLEVGNIVLGVANGMEGLHEHNIIHRDLKASNVLIQPSYQGAFDPVHSAIMCFVADFECSVGVVGTEYWRAPEILWAVQHHDIKPELFTEKSDVYGFAMTCYEVLTGRIPFEDLGGTCYNIVIDGHRPELPDHIDPWMKSLLSRCWHVNPLERPCFEEIRKCLIEFYTFLVDLSDDEASDSE